MSESEITEAAERRQSTMKLWTENRHRYQSDRPIHSTAANLADELAKLYDATPLTRKLFQQMGGKWRMNGDIRQCTIGPATWFDFASGGEVLVNDNLDHPIRTAGQLRALCLALGITLKE